MGDAPGSHFDRQLYGDSQQYSSAVVEEEDQESAFAPPKRPTYTAPKHLVEEMKHGGP